MQFQSNQPATMNQHTGHSIEPHTIFQSSVYGALLTAVGFSLLGLFIGYNRAPGSFYTYGFSCFVWPVFGMILLGGAVGAALGFIFGSIAHANDGALIAGEPALNTPAIPANQIIVTS